MGAKEQKYLLDNKFDDVCLNKSKVDYHNDKRGYLYVSDIIEQYVKAAQRKEEAPGTIDNNPLQEIPLTKHDKVCNT